MKTESLITALETAPRTIITTVPKSLGRDLAIAAAELEITRERLYSVLIWYAITQSHTSIDEIYKQAVKDGYIDK